MRSSTDPPNHSRDINLQVLAKDAAHKHASECAIREHFLNDFENEIKRFRESLPAARESNIPIYLLISAFESALRVVWNEKDDEIKKVKGEVLGLVWGLPTALDLTAGEMECLEDWWKQQEFLKGWPSPGETLTMAADSSTASRMARSPTPPVDHSLLYPPTVSTSRLRAPAPGTTSAPSAQESLSATSGPERTDSHTFVSFQFRNMTPDTYHPEQE